MGIDEREVFDRLGREGLARLVRAFYARAAADDVLGPMYRAAVAREGGTMADAEGRLLDFLVQRFGGPGAYSERRGHPRLRMRHMAFAIDGAAAERWLSLMDAALGEAGVPADVAGVLRPYFRQTALFMVNR